MKMVVRNRQMAAAVMAVAVFVFGALAVLAWPVSRKWRVDVIPANYTGDVSLVAGSAGEIGWVRWYKVGSVSNDVAATVALVSEADGWSTQLAAMTLTNAQTVAGALMVEGTNGQWRIGDKLRLAISYGVTNGTVAVGYWYYD